MLAEGLTPNSASRSHTAVPMATCPKIIALWLASNSALERPSQMRSGRY